jgi:hypothetical protein
MMTASLFQRLCDSEINFEVSCFWDDYFFVRLGDAVNGFDEQERVRTWAEVEGWLRVQALKHYPNSAFAKQELGAQWTPIKEPHHERQPRNGP